MIYKEFKTIFMYAGQGSHYYNMGRELYEKEGVFRRNMDACDDIVRNELEYSLTDAIYASNKRYEEFSNILYTHPAIFSFQYSLTKLLYSKGIFPDMILGYSLGEIVGTVISGMLSLEDGLRLIMKQANLLNHNPPSGGMLVVLGDFQQLQHVDLITKSTLAVENYKGNFVLSGERENLLRLKDYLLKLYSVSSTMLPVNYAFHSEKIDFLKPKMISYSRGITFSLSQIPLLSSALASEVTKPDERYFWNIARSKIRFQELIKDLINKDESYCFVDLSATGSLSNFISKGSFSSQSTFPLINQFGENSKTLNKFLSNYL